ncbi:hypothetical protein J6590_032558 [Homalodisca vitripennis]|nr:hypothetical protein J6590_032558 [Homalodisca vitripennis]
MLKITAVLNMRDLIGKLNIISKQQYPYIDFGHNIINKNVKERGPKCEPWGTPEQFSVENITLKPQNKRHKDSIRSKFGYEVSMADPIEGFREILIKNFDLNASRKADVI